MIYCKCTYKNVHIRFRLYIMKLNVVLWKYISDGNEDYFTVSRVEIHLHL